MKHTLFLFLTIPLPAAVTNVTVEALSGQAILRYTAPDSGRCTVAMSEAASLSPLISDVDSSKFTNAGSDARFSFLDAGLNRTFVAGQKAATRGTDSVVYSRALKNNTVYFYQITCGASQTGVLTFSTATAPLGLMYVDPVQADPTVKGEMLNPFIDFSQRNTLVDPQTAVAMKQITLPGDVVGCGLGVCGPFTMTSAFIDKVGTGWTGSNYPYTITNDASSSLVLEAAGFHFWPSYPFNSSSASYSSSVQANLTLTQLRITAQSNNSGCPSAGARCTIVVCLSADRVTCHPWSTQITQALTNSSASYTLGTANRRNLSGWIAAGHRGLNGPETADRSSTLTCNGSNTVLLDPGQPASIWWSNGTPITINGTKHLIASIADEQTLVLQDTCNAGAGIPFQTSTLAWLVKAQAASSDTITISQVQSDYEYGISPQWPDGAFWNEHSKQTVNGVQGEAGHLVQAQSGLGNYWVGDTTATTSLIGVGLTFNGTPCSPTSAAWDTRVNVAIQYCLAGNQLYADTYTPTDWTGASSLTSNGPIQWCNSIAPPCWTEANLTAGTTLETLAQAFDSSYPSASKGMSFSFLNGINPLNHLIFNAWSGDGRIGWIFVFDPVATSNSRPGNGGCVGALLGNSHPGCFIAGIPTYLRGGALLGAGRGQPQKGDIRPDFGPGIVVWQPFHWDNDALNGGGPWQVNATGGFAFSVTTDAAGGPTTCPSNNFAVTGKNCTLVPVDGEPYDPNPGTLENGSRAEYITATEGDYFGINSNQNGLPQELIRLIRKNSSTSWWVQRAATRDAAYCTPPAVIHSCGTGGPVSSSAANPTLQYPQASGNVFWDYLHDPAGQTLVQSYDYDSTCHRATLNGMDIDPCQVNSDTGGNDSRCVDPGAYCYGARIDPSGSTWNLLTHANREGVGVMFPRFANIVNSPPVGINLVQSHPSVAGAFGTADRRRYWQDARPFNGLNSIGAASCLAVNVSGPLWKIPASCSAAGGPLNRKYYPTKAQWGWHPLLDVSGPGCAIGNTSADNYKYAVVVVAGECATGSNPGDEFFNVPWLRYPYSAYPGQATSGADLSDITIIDNSPGLDAIVQGPMDDPSDRGRKQRVLTHLLSPGKVNVPFLNVDAWPNNEWLIARTAFLNSVRADILLIQRPPEVQDSIDRGKFATPAVTIPAAPGFAMIEWGYLEYGSDGIAKFNCTSRAENCRSSTNSAAAPFWFASETQTPTACSGGCSIQASLIPDRVALWRWVRTDASGNITATGPTLAMATR